MLDRTFAARLRRTLEARRRRCLTLPGARPAAVLVPLFAAGESIHVLFTRRTETVPHHQGQVSFPGGRHRPQDGSSAATAIREACEEIGLKPGDVNVLGALDDMHTLHTNFLITPFVAVIPYPYAFRPDPVEVAEIFSVPLSVLRDPAARREALVTVENTQLKVPAIRYRDHVIWGATERISRNLIEVTAAADGGGGWRQHS